MKRKGMILSQNQCFYNPKTVQVLGASPHGPQPGLRSQHVWGLTVPPNPWLHWHSLGMGKGLQAFP